MYFLIIFMMKLKLRRPCHVVDLVPWSGNINYLIIFFISHEIFTDIENVGVPVVQTMLKNPLFHKKYGCERVNSVKHNREQFWNCSLENWDCSSQF